MEETKERRLEEIHRKNITLTTYGREQILAWANEEGLTFSSAIEALALLALSEKKQEVHWEIALLRSLIEQVLQGNINRFAQLLGSIMFDVHYCHTMLDALALQVVRQTAEKHPDDIARVMVVKPDSQNKVDKAIRQMHEKWKQSVESRAKQQLRERLEDEKPWLLPYLTQGEEVDEA